MNQALAHSFYDPLPTGIFQFKLDWDPTVVFFLCMAYLYYKGLKEFRTKTPVKRWQIFCFYAGITSNVIALLPPVDPLSDRLFFAHMIQHMIIMMIGAPLIILGAPFYVISRGLGRIPRTYILLPMLKNKFLRILLAFLGAPLVSLAFYNLNLWFWHIPRFYNWALLNDLFHIVEHALFALSSILLWRNIIDPYPLRSKLHMGFRILYLAGTMAVSVGLAAFLSYHETVLYAYEGIPMPQWWSYRWTHLDDQRLGGLIMWVPGGFLMFLYMTITFFVWAKREQEKDRKEIAALKEQVSR
jgi:putative membrane protein